MNKSNRIETRSDSAAGRIRHSIRLTPLDKVIINTIVDSRQGVVGALSRQELNRAIDEFVNLSGRRQQSQFHAGFRDALFDLPLAGELPAQNEKRARWYWTGVVQGLARSESWNRIVEAYDGNETVRGLGDGSDAASLMAGNLIAKALWKSGRIRNLHSYVGIPLVRRDQKVHQLMLQAGTEALRSRSPGVARRIFALLIESGDSQKQDSHVARFVPTVQRRMAHCHRLLGDHLSAEKILHELLRSDQDMDIQAMVHADLGLLKGGFSLLDEVKVPDEESARKDLVERLKAGEGHFRDAVAHPDVPNASHGHYCLGVLALANDESGSERFEEADMHLERCHAHFHGNDKYPLSLISHTALYLGIAKLQLLDASEIHHAARLVVSGLGGAAIPDHFISPVIDSLALSDESIGIVANPLLKMDDDKILDSLAGNQSAHGFLPISEKLKERAQRPNRRKSLSAKDLRIALRGFLDAGEMESAHEVLDRLEQLAMEGSGVKEFIALLGEPEAYEPAWEREDSAIARARCLEVEGKYVEALARLRDVFHAYMQRDDVHDALGVLERIRGYGLDRSQYRDLEQRYESSSTDGPLVPDSRNNRPVTVLVIGGNEIQEKFAGQLKTKIEERDPNTTVEFLHTGWSSNWNRYIEEIDRRLDDCDAVVIVRFILRQAKS